MGALASFTRLFSRRIHRKFLPVGCFTLLLTTIAWCGAESVSLAGELKVHTDFPSGSGDVVLIDQSRRLVRLAPKDLPGRGWRCWWYAAISGIEPGEEIVLEVGHAPWATPLRAAVSTDGETWTQTSPGRRRGDQMRYRYRSEHKMAWFAWGPPFTVDHARRLVDKSASSLPDGSAFSLCTTRGGQEVPAVRFPCTRSEGRPLGVWVQARQHAWEVGSSWVCAGFMDWLSSDAPRAVRLRERATITVVPIMDVDSVLDGAGGKEQDPHDHNRDWGDQPHWPAVQHAIREIQTMDRKQEFDLFVDLHNPGPSIRTPFFFITPRELLPTPGRRNVDHFLRVAQFEMSGPLPFLGDSRESGRNYDVQWEKISKNWVSLNTSPHVVSLTLETAWNTPHSTVEGYQTVGRQLGLAMERYFRTNPRTPSRR